MKTFEWNSRDDQSQRKDGQLQLMLHRVMGAPVEQYVIVCFVLRDGAEAHQLAPGVSAHMDSEAS